MFGFLLCSDLKRKAKMEQEKKMDLSVLMRMGAFRNVYTLMEKKLMPIDRIALMCVHPRFVFLEAEHTKESQNDPMAFGNLWLWMRTLCAHDFCTLFVPGQHSVRNLLAAKVLENMHVCPERKCFLSNISWLRLLTGKVECTCDEGMYRSPLVDSFNYRFTNPNTDPNALRVYDPVSFLLFDFSGWHCTRVDDKRLFLAAPVFVPTYSEKVYPTPIVVREQDAEETNMCLVAELVARCIWRSGSESRQFDFWSIWNALCFNHRAHRTLRNIFPEVSSLSRRISSLLCSELFQQFLPNDHPFRRSVQAEYTTHLNIYHSTAGVCPYWKCPTGCRWMHMMDYGFDASRTTMYPSLCRCRRQHTPSYGDSAIRWFTCFFPDFEPHTQVANGTLERTSMTFPFKPLDAGWMSCPTFMQSQPPSIICRVKDILETEPSAKKRRNQ